MLKARQAGKVRYIGFTGHKSPEIHLHMLDTAFKNSFTFDTVQVAPFIKGDWTIIVTTTVTGLPCYLVILFLLNQQRMRTLQRFASSWRVPDLNALF